ncbi:cell division protein FtsN [Acerihabitans sp. KWT182]|uniref:Cell division protein FtsN n=1 Tax=Acerihabitans sp. KWT182 TaxID=3157919 RepID=A0AAU7QA55_9GAMM
MAQRDYVSRGRTNTRRRKPNSRKKRSSSGISKTMIALAVAVLVTFIGGLYFIAHNKSEEAVIVPNHGNHTNNGLPPKPEERWRYIKELENRQIGVQTPTEPSAGGEVQSPAQLTDEQRQLLEQMQADMRQQPTHLNEVPYNDQTRNAATTTGRTAANPFTAQSLPRQAPAVNEAAPRQARQAPAATLSTPRQTVTQAAPRQAPSAAVAKPHQAPITAITPPQPRQAAAPTQTPRSEAKTENAAKEKSQRWVIQCGSYKAMDQAESVRAQLAFGGVESRIATSGGWNRVMLGPYPSRASADKSLQNLRSSGVSNCIPIAVGG